MILFLPQLYGAATPKRLEIALPVIVYVIVIKNFLNTKGHQNRINGLKVTVILLKGWILPICGASAVEGLRSTGLPRLVFIFTLHNMIPLNSHCLVYRVSNLPGAPKKFKFLHNPWNFREIFRQFTMCLVLRLDKLLLNWTPCMLTLLLKPSPQDLKF